MFRTSVCALVITSLLSTITHAQSLEHPPALTPEGGMSLPRAGEATRVHLLGTIKVYSLAVYVAGPVDRALLQSADMPKALRIRVLYEDDARRQIALAWRSELVPALEPAATAHLRGTFAGLRRGDVVLIEYVPDRGTTMRVNTNVAVAAVNHDLMLAFLDHWLGQRPVSEEIKRSLVGS